MTYGNSTKYYRANPDKWALRKIQIKEREHQIRDRIREYRKTKVCVQCGFSDYRAIDFHHRDATQKDATPSDMYKKGWGWSRILLELEKCDPMCRNCHAILHAEEREKNASMA